MVHAKAAGAFGFFEVLDDVTDFTDAKFLSSVGKRTDVMTRISTVGGEKGSADTVRDVRGWSTKFYTEDGNQDFVFNDLPVFFLRDPIKFPSMNRSHKKHPRTNVPDNTMFWDYHVNNPEGMHALIHLFGQRGIPASLRHINGFGVHTYTLTKSDGTFVYIKWHWKPEGGIQTLDSETAARLAGTDPDYHVKDIFNAIEKGDYPTWLLYIQVIRPEEVDLAPFDIFDGTFTWPHAKYPLRRVGRLTLNRNVRLSPTLTSDFQLTQYSPTTTFKTSNKPRSRLRTWSRVSVHLQTWVSTAQSNSLAGNNAKPRDQFSRHACLRTQMLLAIAWAPITNNFLPIAPTSRSIIHTNAMVGLVLTAIMEATRTTSDPSYDRSASAVGIVCRHTSIGTAKCKYIRPG
jgi:hypothetical protein